MSRHCQGHDMRWRTFHDKYSRDMMAAGTSRLRSADISSYFSPLGHAAHKHYHEARCHFLSRTQLAYIHAAARRHSRFTAISRHAELYRRRRLSPRSRDNIEHLTFRLAESFIASQPETPTAAARPVQID